jgi:hypothetical protein
VAKFEDIQWCHTCTNVVNSQSESKQNLWLNLKAYNGAISYQNCFSRLSVISIVVCLVMPVIPVSIFCYTFAPHSAMRNNWG